MTDSPAIVHIVDDDESLRTALARLLRASGHEVRMYGSAGEFLIADISDAPGCLILDVQLPGPSGLELQQALERHQRFLPVIFLTGHGDIATSVKAMRAGAVDFLTKPVEREPLLSAVSAALARNAHQRAARASHAALRERAATLTGREREVFAFVIRGFLNKQIAAEIGCSIRTVKIHRQRVMEKMQADSVAELVRTAEALRLHS